jgi:plastocyanin
MLRLLRAVVVGCALAAGLMSGACGGSGSTPPSSSGPKAAATVKLEPTTFNPADVSVKVGETVRWVWGGGVQHDVKSDDANFDSGVKSSGSFDHTFDTAGTFHVICTVHPATMKGTVAVS